MSDQILISFENASILNKGHQVFENLDFTIKQHEHWAVVGPGGSGKTSLLEAICGKLPISKGKLSRPEKDKLVGETQHTVCKSNSPKTYFGYLTVRHHFKNLSNRSQFYYQQRFNASDADDAPTVADHLQSLKKNIEPGFWTFKKVVDRLSLAPLFGESLIMLSNGETKKLLLASELLKNPHVLLLDNLFVGIDHETRIDLHALIAEIANSGINIVMATTPNEIPETITHVALLGEGKTLSTQLRESFHNAEIRIHGSEQIDQLKLKKLLNTGDLPQFDLMIAMKDVVVKYGEKTILDQVNWQVRQGERWAVNGQNGAGKSTLLSLINGDNPQAYANDIILLDRKRGSGESIWDIKKHIGYVSSELFQFFPGGMTCLQVIESGFYDTNGLFRASDPIKTSECLEWMKLFGIGHLAGHLLREVPTSTQRYCLLIRALVKKPILLILDEAFQNLDLQQIAHAKSLINQICENSRLTLIFVSHYQDELPNCITHMLKLKNGKATIVDH